MKMARACCHQGCLFAGGSQSQGRMYEFPLFVFGLPSATLRSRGHWVILRAIEDHCAAVPPLLLIQTSTPRMRFTARTLRIYYW